MTTGRINQVCTSLYVPIHGDALHDDRSSNKHNLGRKGTDRGSIFRRKSTLTNIRTLIQGEPTAPFETELMRNDLVKGVFSSHNRS